MKVGTFAIALLFGATIVGCFVNGNTRAQADDVYTACPAFTGHGWVNPYPPNNGGTHYQLALSGTGGNCAFALTWAKKFTAQHFPTGGNALSFANPKGPAGWKCHAGLDQKGYAYQGSCTKVNSMDSHHISTAFNWSPNQ